MTNFWIRGMRYSERFTKELEGCGNHLHPLSKLLAREGANSKELSHSLCDSIVVDFEAFADQSQCGGDKSKRVDIMYAVQKGQQQLVECKFEIEQATNLKNHTDDLKEKRTESRNHCNSKFTNQPVLETVYLIVDKNKEERAKSVVSKLFPAKNNTPRPYEVMSIHSLLKRDFGLRDD